MYILQVKYYPERERFIGGYFPPSRERRLPWFIEWPNQEDRVESP